MAPDSADPWRQDIPGVAAHRGGRNLGPENTIYGILEGLGAGATHLEVDVRGTADGHAVCHHDANAERTCREDAEIAELDDVPRTTGRESAEAFFLGEPVDADAVVIPPEHEGVQLVEPEAVEMAHDQGIAFWVWTINEAQQARELFELGVDGVITDQPDKLVRERARWM